MDRVDLKHMKLKGRTTKFGRTSLSFLIAGPMITACGALDSQSKSQSILDSIADSSCSNIAQIYGDWDVSLLYDPSKPPNSTQMSIGGDGNTVISGSFYDTPFSSSQVTATNGQYILASATSDNSGEYIHMARYDCTGDTFAGQTWSRGRNFVMGWTAIRQ